MRMRREKGATYVGSIGSLSQMWIHTQSRPIRLCESPQDVFRSLVNIGTTYER